MRLQNLARAQIAFGVVAAALATIDLHSLFDLGHILIVPLFASALGQAVLLAVWGVASTSSPWIRMAGLVAGAAYLEALFAPSMGTEFLGTATITIAVTTASMLVVQMLGISFTRRVAKRPPGRPDAEGLQFSIRGLMLITAAVALLSTGVRALRASRGHFLLVAAVWALCFVTVGLVALWAALGEARPQRRGPVVFTLSLVLGTFFAYAVAGSQAEWFYVLLIMLLFPADLIGSLLVVRSCGYRLVRRASSLPNSRSGVESLEEPSLIGSPAGRNS